MLPELTLQFIAVLIFFQTGMSQPTKDIATLFPQSVDGWRPAASDKCFNPDNLYEHINGGAELFISYDFKKSCTRTYSHGDEAEISIDIFDMGVPKNAFGVFGHSRETTDRTVGQGCQIYEDAVIFWQSRYYVAITCFKCPDDIQGVLLRMARHISDAIGEQGTLPAVITKLPADGLHRESILYFNHPAWQNAYYYFSDDNYLNINKNTDAVLAKYDAGDEQVFLMLIQYPDEQKAKAGLMNFREKYLEGAPEQFIKLEDGYWLGLEQKHDFVVMVFHSKSIDHARALLHSVIEKL